MITSRRRRRVDGERGTTLVEMSVALGLLGVVGAVVTSAVISLSHSYRTTEAHVTAQQQVGLTFARLDRSLRFAADASAADRQGRPSLVFLTTVGAPRCTALWLDNGKLWTQAWTPPGPPPTATVLATDVTAAPGRPAFAVSATGGQEATSASVKRVSIALSTVAHGSAPRELSADFPLPNSAAGPHDATLGDCSPTG